MKKRKKLNLGKIKIVNFNAVYKLIGGQESNNKSCGGDDCDPEVTQTNTDTREIDGCKSISVCNPSCE
ncbi:hypothetical protein IMCC3317_23530 [Kordia antarctica]|uniref:Uncharacterized protein n=1 Tax=Kordia antarctica TaxID=1218801 RepID=A0A7L4ZK19_9FLAO|nr:hypothetical protein [Kordia antarctica]QHI36982.1 hypothetical protein IMCC3317_23530 [Kordia antarctica]